MLRTSGYIKDLYQIVTQIADQQYTTNTLKVRFSVSLSRMQCRIYLFLHFIFLIKNCVSFINDKSADIYQDKMEDLLDEDKLQNIVWMNMFGTYPTVNVDNAKSRLPNLTHDLLTTDKSIEFVKSNEEKLNSEEKIEKPKMKFELTNTERSILEIMEDSPLYQLCLRTLNSPETCLTIFLRNSNFRKLFTDKQHICASSPTWLEFRQCIQQQLGEDNFKFIEKYFVPMVKKNAKIADTPKRLPFHAWGGKRFNQVGTEKVQTSRVPFNAWGGKRQEPLEQQLFNPYGESCEPCKRSKAKFHSWGGKRSKRKSS